MLRYLRCPRCQRGWIFIDALIGMVIVAIALTALAVAYSQSTASSASSNNYLRAVYIAQAQLESLKRFDRQLPNSIVLPAPQQMTMGGYPQQFTVQVQQINVAALGGLGERLVPVRVTVTWQEPRGGAGQVQLTGYYYQLERP